MVSFGLLYITDDNSMNGRLEAKLHQGLLKEPASRFCIRTSVKRQQGNIHMDNIQSDDDSRKRNTSTKDLSLALSFSPLTPPSFRMRHNPNTSDTPEHLDSHASVSYILRKSPKQSLSSLEVI